MIKLLEEIDEMLAAMECVAHGMEGRIITEMRGRIQTELSNSHKPVVMQGLPTDEEIRAQALLMENKFDNHTAKIIARASYESGARWVISKLSGSPTVASEGLGEANKCVDAGCPQCKNTDIYDIDDHWTKCNNCGFTFVG